MSAAFLEALAVRRSHYPLTKTLPAHLTKDRLDALIKQTIRLTPSSFNSQSNRAVLLLGAEHEKLWDITRDTLKAIVPADSWEATGKKMDMFRGAAGTVLVFEDETVIRGMEEKFAIYKERFAPWAAQSSGMLESNLWTALAAEGLGANLQHYNPLINAKVTETWGLPESWTLNAQLVFGGKTGELEPKDKLADEEVFKSFGA